MYFYNINIFDKQDKLIYIETTKAKVYYNTALVNLQGLSELQGDFRLTLKTNTTVYLSLQVWDYDADSGTNDKMRVIDNLVIPFNEITKSSVWTDKRFILSDGAYLKIQFRIFNCYSTTGLGCNFCMENLYTSSCDKYCLPVQGSYTCSTSGDKVCAEHKTGDNCDMCQKEWSGEHCEECAENYFPEKVCDVTCIAVEGRYACSNIGKKVCDENWAGVECDTCAEHRTGETCEQCSEGWGGNKCQECDKDYYPEGVCNVSCTEEKNKFTCADDGSKDCYENWKGEECENCSEGYFSELCDVFCKETGHYNCNLTGEKVCLDGSTTVENNCQKLKKNTRVNIGTLTVAVVSTITAVVMIIYVMILRKRLKENELSLARRSNKTANAEIPEGERDNIVVEYACADEVEDDETYADVTILDYETIEMTRQKYKKEGAYVNVRL